MIKSFLAKSLMLAAVSAGMLPVAASAGEVQHRLNEQQARINQGVRDGQLTRGEYAHVERDDARIEWQRNRDLARNGGHLTAGEYNHLNRELNRNSGSIYFDKHDLRRQPGAPLR